MSKKKEITFSSFLEEDLTKEQIREKLKGLSRKEVLSLLEQGTYYLAGQVDQLKRWVDTAESECENLIARVKKVD